MTLQRADGPVDDPFFAAVRRRHPDVDLVLLPPEPPPPDADPTAVAAVRADLETVRVRAAELGAGLGSGEARFELGTLGGTLRACVRAVTRGCAPAVLDELAASATERGWSLLRHAGPVELLQGSLDDLRLRASHASTTGVLVVEVTGPDRPVGQERARELAGDS